MDYTVQGVLHECSVVVLTAFGGNLQVTRTVHHMLEPLYFSCDDLPAIQPSHNLIRVLDVLRWLDPASIGYWHVNTALLLTAVGRPTLEIVDFSREVMEKGVLIHKAGERLTSTSACKYAPPSG